MTYFNWMTAIVRGTIVYRELWIRAWIWNKMLETRTVNDAF